MTKRKNLCNKTKSLFRILCRWQKQALKVERVNQLVELLGGLLAARHTTGGSVPVSGPDSPLEIDNGAIPVDVDLHEDR